jgi:hypothetical protein
MAEMRQTPDQQSSNSDQLVQQLIQYLGSSQRFVDQQQSIIRGQDQLIQLLSGLLATMPAEGTHLLQNVNTGKEGLEQLRIALATRLETLNLNRGSAGNSPVAGAVSRIIDALRPIEPPKPPEQKSRPVPDIRPEMLNAVRQDGQDDIATRIGPAVGAQEGGRMSSTLGVSQDEAQRLLEQYEHEKSARMPPDAVEVAPASKEGVTYLELDLAKPKQRVRIPSGTTKIGRTDRAYFSGDGPKHLRGKFSTPTLIVLVEDPNKHTVSSVHGYIISDGLRLTYYDKSSNGSFVKSPEEGQYSPVMGGNRQNEDGTAIPDFRVLRDGDQIRFGPKANAVTIVRLDVEERVGVKEPVWYFLT